MLRETISIQRPSAIKDRLSEFLRANHYLFLDLVILIAICIPLTALVEGTLIPLERYVTWADNPWYLNRGALLTRGVADSAFVYTLFYPILVSLVNNFTHDLIATGILINRVVHSVLIIGTYGLGRIFYNRRIAWIAALLISLNIYVFMSTRLTQPFLMFYALVVVCVLAYALLVRRPTIWSAILCGFVLLITLYTRLEGITYTLLIPLAAWQIYRSTRSAKLALRLAVISSSIVAVGTIYYASVMLQHSDFQTGPAFTLLIMLRTTPFPWKDLWDRFMETLYTLTMGWPAIVTIGALVWVAWNQRRDRAANGLFVLLILIGFINLFVLSIRPKLYVSMSSFTFVGLLFAAFIVRLQSRWRWLWSICVLAILSVAVLGLINLVQYAATPRDDYRVSRLGLDAVRVDAWLAGQGLQDTEIYTFCSPLTSYSRSNFHLIYRLGLREVWNDDLYNSPRQLLPVLHEQGKLFMRCAEEGIFFSDWENFLGESANVEAAFQEIGRVDNYVFYEVK